MLLPDNYTTQAQVGFRQKNTAAIHNVHCTCSPFNLVVHFTLFCSKECHKLSYQQMILISFCQNKYLRDTQQQRI